uniref:Small ribosomal subunit protein uS8c n=1 Tax=Pterocladiophila hemisphaerica TaxID=2712948 RepID=A0A6M3WWG8_9FLOR|nr:ribosomal protein S8 [Pterocladiophila hemisphaerica]
MFNDTISNILTILRNGNAIKKKIVQMSANKITAEILHLLVSEKYIDQYISITVNNKLYFLVFLKFSKKNKMTILNELKRISTPSLRLYTRSNNIPQVLNGLATVVISTSKGILTNHFASFYKIGGEMLFYIW